MFFLFSTKIRSRDQNMEKKKKSIDQTEQNKNLNEKMIFVFMKNIENQVNVAFITKAEIYIDALMV